MKWRLDRSGWDYEGRIYGLPVLIRDPDGDCEMVGANVLADHLLTWWPEFALWFQNRMRFLFGMPELPGWPIWIGERIDNAEGGEK